MWGNSLALRVPKAFAQELGASVGKAANMEVRDGKLVVEIAKSNRRRRRYTLDRLVAGISPKNRHASSNGGRPLAKRSGDYYPDAGDLVWIDLNPTLGHEQSGHRPAIVLTPPRQYNVRSGLCIICPITSRARDYSFEVVIPNGRAISGIVLVDQVRSLSWEKRYVKMAGVAPVKLLDEVRERLAVLLQID